jgi:hypothetical protein
MKKLILTAVAIGLLFSSQAQTLYVPNGVSGISSSTGNVGIGTTTSSPSHILSVNISNSTVAPWASLLVSNGLAAASSGNSTATYVYNQSQGGIHGVNAADYGNGTYIPLYLGWGGNKVIIAKDGGNVGIGTTQPDYPLTVNGTIHATEVRIDPTVPAPDYVFENDYKLATLEDIKTYIDQNKHLPEVPSAKEIEKNGVHLGEMNLLLLKKIEELTLYVIDLKKENQEQKIKSEAQQKEIEVLKSKIK